MTTICSFSAEDIPAHSRILEKLEKRAKAAVNTGTPAAAVKAVERLVEADPSAYEPFEILSQALERKGDMPGAARTMLNALDRSLCDSIGKPVDFIRMRSELHRLEAASPRRQGGKIGKAR